MSDTAEQGVTPGDPAHRAGIGSGLIPDDLGEGLAQAEELAEHPPSDEAGKTASHHQVAPPDAAKRDDGG